MPVTENDLKWFAARLSIAVYDTNQEHRRKMSVEVKGLADMVRLARDAIGKASTAAERMQGSATTLVATVAQVEGMISQLNSANADLTAALGTMSNGGPPLETITPSAPVTPAPSVTTQTTSASVIRDDTGNVEHLTLANGETV